jgi:GNAT superfamily N-acetyltransferase
LAKHAALQFWGKAYSVWERFTLSLRPVRGPFVSGPRVRAGEGATLLAGDEVVGFYTLVVAQVEYDDAPQRLGKGLAKHPIPLLLLARLAVATSWQGKGLGSGLLKDAMLRTLRAADIAGIRAMAVHAKDDDVRAFDERFGFVPAPTDPYHLFVLLKDVRAILKQR